MESHEIPLSSVGNCFVKSNDTVGERDGKILREMMKIVLKPEVVGIFSQDKSPGPCPALSNTTTHKTVAFRILLYPPGHSVLGELALAQSNPC